ncbi:MAG: class A beta-lactamase-related serine hydrolase [Planctomycetes bacterium]|nr:class A beta-lactamase-related serine hydrolase [Planctomycetota bacterium]
MQRLSLLLLVCLGLAPRSFAQAPAATDLGERIEEIRKEAGIPALGGALVTLDGLQGVWVTGTRRAGGEDRVTTDDLWHLGSCTKSMTATLIALLVARGDLAWETALGELMPDIASEMDVDYADLTLVELLCHRAGLPANSAEADFRESEGRSVVEQREHLMRAVFGRPPDHPPRGALLYSNTGFMIAGHIAERVTGKPWETLMQELLFTPLGMTSAGFGPPGSAAVCDQPRGHTEHGEPLEPGPEADNPPVIGPAGTVHCSLADWAKYVRLHLAGARGDVKIGELTLTRDAFARLHTPYDGPKEKYGFGWVFEKRPWAGGDGTAFWHNGSNTLWYCVTWLGPANGVAVLVTTNSASAKAKGATDQVAALLLAEYARRTHSAETR